MSVIKCELYRVVSVTNNHLILSFGAIAQQILLQHTILPGSYYFTYIRIRTIRLINSFTLYSDSVTSQKMRKDILYGSWIFLFCCSVLPLNVNSDEIFSCFKSEKQMLPFYKSSFLGTPTKFMNLVKLISVFQILTHFHCVLSHAVSLVNSGEEDNSHHHNLSEWKISNFITV